MYQQKDHYRILVINGGGVRGIIPATILKYLEQKANENITKAEDAKNITDLFDYIIGTSIGGILAGGLTVHSKDNKSIPRYSIDDNINILETKAQIIFPQLYAPKPCEIIAQGCLSAFLALLPFLSPCLPTGFTLKGILALTGATIPVMYSYIYPKYIREYFYPKYSRKGLDGVLHDVFEDTRFNDTILPVTMISYALDQDKPRVWSSLKAINKSSDNHLLKDAAGATSAAPTYFPEKITSMLGETYYDIDGGIFANSGILIGTALLLKNNTHISNKNLTVVSVGTGWTKGIGSHTSGGKFSWISGNKIIDTMLRASEFSDIISAQKIYHSHIILNPQIPVGYDLDNPAQINELKEITLDYIKNNGKHLDHTVNCLEGIGNKDFSGCYSAVELNDRYWDYAAEEFDVTKPSSSENYYDLT